jgi:putative transposase
MVIDCNEAYTSKTVSWTGEVIDNLGGARVIKSPSTGLKMDRGSKWCARDFPSCIG